MSSIDCSAKTIPPTLWQEDTPRVGKVDLVEVSPAQVRITHSCGVQLVGSVLSLYSEHRPPVVYYQGLFDPHRQNQKLTPLYILAPQTHGLLGPGTYRFYLLNLPGNWLGTVGEGVSIYQVEDSDSLDK